MEDGFDDVWYCYVLEYCIVVLMLQEGQLWFDGQYVMCYVVICFFYLVVGDVVMEGVWCFIGIQLNQYWLFQQFVQGNVGVQVEVGELQVIIGDVCFVIYCVVFILECIDLFDGL